MRKIKLCSCVKCLGRKKVIPVEVVADTDWRVAYEGIASEAVAMDNVWEEVLASV